MLSLLLITTPSRGGFLAAIVFVLLYSGNKILPKITKGLSYLLFLFVLSFPFWLYFLLKFLPLNYLIIVNRISANRIYLWQAYLKMFVDHPLGVGYFKGSINSLSYKLQSVHLTNGILLYPNSEQHNIYLQILTEFGCWGYFLFSYLLCKLFKQGQNGRNLLISLMIIMLFLNFTNEFVFYLVLGYIFSISTPNAQPKTL